MDFLGPENACRKLLQSVCNYLPIIVSSWLFNFSIQIIPHSNANTVTNTQNKKVKTWKEIKLGAHYIK
jgi:hypothetical protein